MKRNKKESHPPIKKAMRESSLQEIGDKLGLTRRRICQIEKLILEKLKKGGQFEKFNDN